MASLTSLTWAILASTSVRDTSSVCLLNVLAEEFRTFSKASKPFKIASFVRPPCDWAVARAALYLNALSVMTEVSGAAKASILASSGTGSWLGRLLGQRFFFKNGLLDQVHEGHGSRPYFFSPLAPPRSTPLHYSEAQHDRTCSTKSVHYPPA